MVWYGKWMGVNGAWRGVRGAWRGVRGAWSCVGVEEGRGSRETMVWEGVKPFRGGSLTHNFSKCQGR